MKVIRSFFCAGLPSKYYLSNKSLHSNNTLLLRFDESLRVLETWVEFVLRQECNLLVPFRTGLLLKLDFIKQCVTLLHLLHRSVSVLVLIWVRWCCLRFSLVLMFFLLVLVFACFAFTVPTWLLAFHITLLGQTFVGLLWTALLALHPKCGWPLYFWVQKFNL